LLGQPEPTVEANVHAEGIPGLQADVTAADQGMFIVVVEVEAAALFTHGLKPSAVTAAAHGHGQAGFDGAQDRDQAALDVVALGDVLNQLLFAGLAGAQEVVRPSGRGGLALSLLQEAVSQRFGVLGEVHEADFGRAQVGPHPWGRKERAQAGVKAEAVPTTQRTLDERTKLVDKAFGNEVFR
jgi:hypothetical protein